MTYIMKLDQEREIVLIAHDLRSTHNVGSLLRTAEGLGVSHVYFTGYTPYPHRSPDSRLPHIAEKLDKQIHKTALGAETQVAWSHHEDVEPVLQQLKADGFQIAALEQTPTSIMLPTYKPPHKVAIMLGREVEGIDSELLKHCDVTLEIPMFGHKESFNVVQAAAMTLYAVRFA
jgi:23S rRNA (guanosine2251-2'-O)-methyltransferase